MKNPKISIIVPIYNVESYVEDSLNCLVNQTFIDNIEVLMIDDGSTDNSRYIIEKYALDYDNFYAFHKENEGPAITRNYAMSLAKGEYIQFFDADDYITPTACEKLYNLAKKNNSDIVTSYSMRLRKYNITESVYFKKSFKDIKEDINDVNLENYPNFLWDLMLWNKLYKKEFIEKNDLKFINENRFYTDGPFALKAYSLAEKISLSRATFYYWRIRENKNLSATQQHFKIKNFKDRLKNLSLSKKILEESNFNDEIKEILYLKWLSHDLELHYSNFNQYDKKFHLEIIEETNKLIDNIPNTVKEKLNSYQKIIYKMVENKDIDGLIYFTPLKPDLINNPHIPENLNEKYLKYINFDEDIKSENLIVKKEEISNDDKNLYIEFSEKIKYLKEESHKNNIKLINENKEYPLELDENKRIIVPINLINKHSNIKVEYINENFKKESFLTNSKRELIELKDYDIQIGIEKNRILCIDKRHTNDLKIKIEKIIFEDNLFKFYGISENKINNIYIKNLIDFNKINYHVVSNKNGNIYNINFSIPYADISNTPVKKWELLSENEFKSIKLTRKFEFYNQYNKILFRNSRNKILIEDDFYNSLNRLDENFNEILEQNKKIKKLERDNIKLKKIIKLYKSRFSVKITDKIKRILK